jgi:hypothetical protein
MAEIKIEKKKPVWPWILVLLVIAALIYFIFCRDNETATDNGTEIENTTGDNTTRDYKERTGSKGITVVADICVVKKYTQYS